MEKAPCSKCRSAKLCNEGTIKKSADCDAYKMWAKKYLGGKKK